MLAPKKPVNEDDRLLAVSKYNLLDTASDADFDGLTALASQYLNTPISLITLLDQERNFLKSHHGIPFNESPREISFCGHAINENKDIFIVEDARKDTRFTDNPLVTDHDAIFYAGVPLVNPDGYKLGTLCVFDHQPRKLSEQEIKVLKSLANQAIRLMELHLKNEQLVKVQQRQAKQNDFLERYAHHVAHDLKSPLNNIDALAGMLLRENKNTLSPKSLLYIQHIEDATVTLKNYIHEILLNYKDDESARVQKSDVDVVSFFETLKSLSPHKKHKLIYPTQKTIFGINKASLSQILINLIDNGYKYNKNKNPEVKITYSETDTFHFFNVSDNGIGIKQKDKEQLFTLYGMGSQKDRHGNHGHGIGLYTIKKLIENAGGEVQVYSELNVGTTFSFSMRK